MHLPPVRRHILQVILQLLALWLALAASPVRGQGVELLALQLERAEGALSLDFSARVTLPKAVEDALQRGVPIYFVAEAQLLRHRWYWRDERVARVSRSWRLAYYPLAGTWRVSQGGLYQTFPTLGEALTTASRSSAWKLAELAQLDPDKSYYLEFSYKLDTSQLPGPMQFGLGGLGVQSEWTVGSSRTLKVDLAPP